MLARELDEHPDELRADLQQYYGLNIDGMGRDFSTLHAAALVAQMPEGSRTARAHDPDAAWTLDRLLAAVVANNTNWLVWSKTKDGQRNRNRPKPIGPDGPGKPKHIRGMAMAPDKLMAELRRIHGEVNSG